MADFKKESRGVMSEDKTVICPRGGCVIGPCECRDNVDLEDVNAYYEELNDKEQSPSDLTIKINADVAEALRGLKALQRELRATTKAAREYEAAINDVELVTPVQIDISTKEEERTYYDLSEVPTAQLTDELAKRDGVREYEVNVEYGAKLSFNEHRTMVNIEGPARIIVNKD